MAQTCSRCSRVNPAEALYCYFDGAVLGSHATNGGPIQTGTQPFHNAFTFPSGKSCRNFDELALSCQENWNETLDLLQQGYIETFLGGLGRADLALATREAARFPDRDRGLDQFLAKLPSNVVEPPKLEVEPREVNLGLLQPGEDRQLDLHLSNQGMRLLYGTVDCGNCVWLALGEPPGASQKLFQFGTETVIPILVRGKNLRAGNKPLEARLTVESNGGKASVAIRAEVPVKPFSGSIFAGARSPRQVAEKAKAHLKVNLKETAESFENGAVGKWYQENGWTYPVQEPVAEGAAAVQQFFDALGLSKPPKVDISERSLTLQGNVGVQLQHILEIKAQERRPIYAYGSSDQPWLEVGRARLNGKTATLTIPLVVSSVPDQEGKTLEAKVTIVANRKQRFTVPVKLEVGGNFNFASFGMAGPAIDDPPAPPPLEAVAPPPVEAPAVKEKEKEKEPVGLPETPTVRPPLKNWIHGIPAALLGLVLLGILFWDIKSPASQSSSDGDFVDPGTSIRLDDPEPRIGIKFNSKMRFGILMLKENDPANPSRHKQLTMREDGETNNTCIRLDGYENLFGQSPGQWMQGKRGSLRQVSLGDRGLGWMSFWEYTQSKVMVRQSVEIVANEQTRLLDTALIHYLIENHDTVQHKVGLRVLIDTFIGTNDGVPFAIPGQPKLLETKGKFDYKDIPDYMQALERPNLKDPGTIAHFGLKLHAVKIQNGDPDELDPVERMVICRWPGPEKRWEWELKAMNEPPDEKKDSCVALYWPEEIMSPGSRRAMAFTYGLGKVSSTGSGQLGLTVGGSFRPDGVFTVTAYVKNAEGGQKVKLVLPEGLILEEKSGGEKQTEEKVVEKSTEYSQVSWRVKATKVGDFHIEVSSGLTHEHHLVHITKAGLFD